MIYLEINWKEIENLLDKGYLNKALTLLSKYKSYCNSGIYRLQWWYYRADLNSRFYKSLKLPKDIFYKTMTNSLQPSSYLFKFKFFLLIFQIIDETYDISIKSALEEIFEVISDEVMKARIIFALFLVTKDVKYLELFKLLIANSPYFYLKYILLQYQIGQLDNYSNPQTYIEAINIINEDYQSLTLHLNNIYYQEIGSCLVWLYLCLGKYASALQLAKEVYYHAKSSHNTNQIILLRSFIAHIYILQGYYSKALYYLELCRKSMSNTRFLRYGIYTYTFLGQIYRDLGNYNQSIIFLKIALDKSLRSKENVEIAMALFELTKSEFYNNTLTTNSAFFIYYPHPPYNSPLIEILPKIVQVLIKFNEKLYFESIELLDNILGTSSNLFHTLRIFCMQIQILCYIELYRMDKIKYAFYISRIPEIILNLQHICKINNLYGELYKCLMLRVQLSIYDQDYDSGLLTLNEIEELALKDNMSIQRIRWVRDKQAEILKLKGNSYIRMVEDSFIEDMSIITEKGILEAIKCIQEHNYGIGIKLLQDTIKKNILTEHKIYCLELLTKIYFDTFVSDKKLSLLHEINEYLNELKTLALKTQSYKNLCYVYLIQAKISRQLFEFQKYEYYLNEIKDIAKKFNYHKILQFIETELSEFNDNINKFEQFLEIKRKDFAINEEQSINDFFNKISRELFN